MPSLLTLDGLPKQEQDEYFFPDNQEDANNESDDDGDAGSGSGSGPTCIIL